MALIAATSLLLSLALADQHLLPRGLSFANTTSDDRFDEYIMAANVSTVREIVLPNIHTSEYPAKGENANWKAWLRVDEKSARGGAMFAGLHPDELYISDNGTIQSDDTWLMCMKLTRFRNPGLPLDATIQSNCSNVFPAECLQFLNAISEDGRLCLNSTMLRDQWKDSPCSGALNGEHTQEVLEPERVFRVTNLDSLQTATSVLGENGSPEKRYDALVNSVYMLAVGFARASNNENRASDTTIDRDAETFPSKFICMRADDFSEGSRTLKDIANRGVGMSAPVGWTMVLAACVLAMTAGIL
ncbi:hypothetical protein V8F33_010718 [Rhypophila sp. PSN 637]